MTPSVTFNKIVNRLASFFQIEYKLAVIDKYFTYLYIEYLT